MVLQLGALRDALIDAGATADKANKAAEEAAGYESRLGRIEADVTIIKGDTTSIKGDIVSVRWVLAIIVPFVLAIAFRVFTH